MRTLAIIMALAWGHLALAQEGRRTLLDRISDILAEDTLAGPNYDTAYIKSYRDNFVVTLVNTVNSGSVTISSSNGKSLEYATNLANNWGIGLDYKWFTLEYTTYVPGMSSSDPTKGVTDHFNFGFGITGRKWWFRNFIARYNGYYVENPTALDTAWDPGDAYPVRTDLGSFTYLASFNHGFNYRRYSHNAFLWQLERQKRSQGSWIAGVTFWYNQLSSDSSLVPAYIRADFPDAANFNQVNRIILSANGGYSYTLALWKKGFLSGLLVPGITMQRQVFFFPGGEANKDTDWGLGVMAEFRIALGYNGDSWYTSLSYANYVASGNVSPDVTIGSGSGVVRFAVGVRLPGLNNPFLKKFGL